jgi:hypothetical protein
MRTMDESLRQHPGLITLLLAVIFLLLGWMDYSLGSKRLACCTWFLGVVILSCSIIGGCLFLGSSRWPIAFIVFLRERLPFGFLVEKKLELGTTIWNVAHSRHELVKAI